MEQQDESNFCNKCGAYIHVDSKKMGFSLGSQLNVCDDCQTSNSLHFSSVSQPIEETAQSLNLKVCPRHHGSNPSSSASINLFTYCVTCSKFMCSSCLLESQHRMHEILPLPTALQICYEIKQTLLKEEEGVSAGYDPSNPFFQYEPVNLRQAYEEKWKKLLKAIRKKNEEILIQISQKEEEQRRAGHQLKLEKDRNQQSLRIWKDNLVCLSGIELITATLTQIGEPALKMDSEVASKFYKTKGNKLLKEKMDLMVKLEEANYKLKQAVAKKNEISLEMHLSDLIRAVESLSVKFSDSRVTVQSTSRAAKNTSKSPNSYACDTSKDQTKGSSNKLRRANKSQFLFDVLKAKDSSVDFVKEPEVFKQSEEAKQFQSVDVLSNIIQATNTSMSADSNSKTPFKFGKGHLPNFLETALAVEPPANIQEPVVSKNKAVNRRSTVATVQNKENSSASNQKVTAAKSPDIRPGDWKNAKSTRTNQASKCEPTKKPGKR